MKITLKDVGYNRGYVIGPYLQERPGINADIALEEGEDPEECALKAMHYLKSITDKFHVQANPHLYPNGESSPPQMITKGAGEVPVISKAAERAEIAIDNAETLADLQLLKGESEKYGLEAQYITKFNELNNGRPREFTEGL